MWKRGEGLGLPTWPLLLLLWLRAAAAIEVPDDLKQPPTITKQSPKDYIVDPRDNIIIECEATGNPPPTFLWKRNSRFFNVAKAPHVTQRKPQGTLEISFRSGGRPEDYEGEYQCFVTNDYGTAFSNKILLRVSKSPLWPKENLAPVLVSEGSQLVLSCNPPPGLPPPFTFWMSSMMMPIRQDARVSMGLNGDLYFSNVVAKDSSTDYSCNARFPFTHTIQQKNPYTLKVQASHNDSDAGDTGGARNVPETAPSFLTPSGLVSSKMVLRGEQLLLECIAAGVPTPSIKWFKKGGELPMRRVKLESFNKTLRITNVSEEDSGDYICMANNKIASIQHTISVQVKAAPYWLDKPENLVLGMDDNGRMRCIAHGNPKPSIQWLVNGEPIEGSRPSASREMQGDTIIFRSVGMGDSAVYQCNASNEHGYLLANAFVNVLDMAPRMLGPKNQLIKVIENNRTLLHCPFFGSPEPVLRWFKNGLGSGLDGGHYRLYLNGTLAIRRALAEDQGTYTCVASNMLGQAENQVRLEVKEPTRILNAPEHLSSTRGATARFNCRIKHDPSLSIQVTWLKNGEPLNLAFWRMKRDDESLSIYNINEGDEGTYTCRVTTELDEDSASARLTVLDRPEAPKDLELSDPLARSIRLTWVPGDDNNSPITEFLVQFEENRWEPRRWQNLSSHPGHMNSVLLELSPFVNYQFRVIAINSVGQSDPSEPSARYQTSGAAPDIAPDDIKGVGSKKNNMEITWKPLSNIQMNGPSIVYEVSWKKKDAEEWDSVNTTHSKHVIHDTETYEPFHIKVQAINDFGRGPESPMALGYSGEDYPSAAPGNLNVSKIDSTKVNLHWDTVEPSSVNGEFKEYRLYYWRESSLVKGLKVKREKQAKGFFSSSGTGILTNLVPYSHYTMHMVVANSRYEGPPSNIVEFKTKEGVPDSPRFFRLQMRSSSLIQLEWDKPLEPNGHLIGYMLQYYTVNETMVGNRQIENFPPNVTSYRLPLPNRFTRYRFYLAARTQVGAGEIYTIETPDFSNEAITTDSVDIATQGWFIGLMCAVALIVLILLIVCFIKRSRGGKYPVRDKKDLPLDPVDHKDQDGSFDYHDEDNKPLQGSQTSLDGQVKESDDSLVEYGECGDGQFNEDGSFIGQYTVKKDKEETEGNESSEATSPVNAIYSLA
ncbi:neurofascin homolog (chicken) a [Engraulis encrasicolus]|uniref:neurofascin homolog (chicken) a n=1 Tax=Engraulis encrasicolus TaxID=184585 RepID=UPI002FCEAF16